MAKIRVISDILTTDDSGNILHIMELCGPKDDIDAMDTSNLANGTFASESDTGKIRQFDEDNGWGAAQ